MVGFKIIKSKQGVPFMRSLLVSFVVQASFIGLGIHAWQYLS